MSPKIKNILIFIIVAAIFVLIYIFFIKSSSDNQPSLVPVGGAPLPSTAVVDNNSVTTKDFLTLLLNVRNIKLDDKIFSEQAFGSLRDSSITLIQDGNEGRTNPFAPLGADVVVIVPPTCVPPQVLDTATNACVTPAPTCVLPKILNIATNTCVNPPPVCVSPKVLNTSTNTCVNPPAH